MFKNPGEKLTICIKVMFWLSSIAYFLFAIGYATFNTFMWLGFDLLVSGMRSSFSLFSSNNSSSGYSVLPFIIWGWALAIISIPVVIILLYQLALLFLTFSDTNKDVKECKRAIAELNNAYFTEGWFSSDMQTLQQSNSNQPSGPPQGMYQPGMTPMPFPQGRQY